MKTRLLVFASIKPFRGPVGQEPSERPFPVVNVSSEMISRREGHRIQTTSGPPEDPERFISQSPFRLPVGWETIEIFPLPDPDAWKPERAADWAERDLLAHIVANNAIGSTLHDLDGRASTRRKYASLLSELESLLEGPEEPAHQFLKKHAELLCPTHQRYWSKLAFGNRISDFVFQELHNDYLLVEIEAPYRKMFREDGQQRAELTHAVNQIADWIQYIADNKERVEKDLGLVGISTNSRTLVVIGRSADLSEENRRKISSLQSLQNKLRILTYDDLLAAARTQIEHILGPIDLESGDWKTYYYKESEVSAALRNEISDPSFMRGLVELPIPPGAHTLTLSALDDETTSQTTKT